LKKKLILIICIISWTITGISCDAANLNDNIEQTIKNKRFDILRWELSAITSEIWQSITIHEPPDRSDLVVEYFNAVKNSETVAINGIPINQLRARVEKIIQRQIREVIGETGIKNPAGDFLGINFPPLSFTLGSPPDLLVTSPRDKIEILYEVRLKPNLPTLEKEVVESKIERTGVSAAVLDLGGISTFPSLINSESTLSDVLNGAAHEWIHQYLTFKPLGFRYVLDLLGIAPDYDVITINETVADIFGDEIGALVYKKYYAGPSISDSGVSINTSFDFNAEMRNIRLKVDNLLEQGKITEAEEYMDTSRQYLQTHGFYIRKLNQAYFAFNGTYASEPSEVSPIGEKLKSIRNESSSIKNFLDTVSRVNNLNQLNKIK
jgi:hypothetical protein